jgi:hypothetical protein
MTTRPTHPTRVLSGAPTHGMTRSRPVWRCRETIYSGAQSDVAGRENINNSENDGEPRSATPFTASPFMATPFTSFVFIASRRCGRAFTLLRAHARDQRCHLHAERRSPR